MNRVWRAIGLFTSLAAAGECTSIAQAQSAGPDSAALYERLAREEVRLADLSVRPNFRASPVALANVMRLARQSHSLYLQRGDELGQARSLLLMAASYDAGRQWDSLLVAARRALQVLRRPNTDSSALATANSLIADGLVWSLGSMDSAAIYRAESVRLHTRFSNSRDVGRTFAGHGDAIFFREGVDATLTGKPAVLDSALRYLHAGLTFARVAADSAQQLMALTIISRIWDGRRQVDSILVYRQQAFEISSRTTGLLLEEQAVGIILALGNAAMRKQLGVEQSLDSALHWARRYRAAAASRPIPDQVASATLLITAHTRAGNPDSARYYIDWLAGVRTSPSATTTTNRGALATWYERRGLADSALMIRREDERRASNEARNSAAIPSQTFAAWSNLARAHLLRGNLDSALFWNRRVLAATSDTTFGDRFPRSFVNPKYLARQDMANVFLYRGQPDSALLQYREMEKEDAEAQSPNTRLRANAARGNALLRARAYFALGMIDSAQGLNEQVLRELGSGAGNEPLASLAEIQRLRGRPDSAVSLDRRALTITLDAGPLADARFYQALGEDFEILGARDSALVYYRAAVDLDERLQLRPNAVTRLGALASWYINADAPDSALALNRRAAALAGKTSIPMLLADVRYRTGIAYGALGQWDSAVVNLESALQPRTHSTLSVLVALGGVRLRMGQPDTAAALLRSALREYRVSREKPAIARTLGLLSRVEIVRGRADTAALLAQESFTLARECQDVVTEGRALSAIGRAQFARGQSAAARASYQSALAVFTSAGFTRDARETLAELADLYRERREPGDLALATAYFDSAAATIDNARRRTGHDENAVAFVEEQTDVFGGWARAWLGRREEVGASRGALAALGAVERGRAQSLLELLQNDPKASQARVARAGADLASEADSLLSAVRAVNGAALSYLHTADTLFTWFVAPDGGVELLPPVALSASELNRLVRSARRSLGADDSRSAELNPDELHSAPDSTSVRRIPADDLKRLAELLLPRDFDKRVPAGTPVVIVPHGSIALIPFAALETGGGGKARTTKEDTVKRSAANATKSTARNELGLRNPLRYAPSFAALRAAGKQDRPSNRVLAQALVVGNPTMPYVYSGRSNTRAKLRPLPGAEAESRTVARMLGAQAITGSAATESVVRNRMASASLIHFATHGLGYGTHTAARRSYVAFAPDAAQDGLLTLGELMDDRTLTLRADLVVLSACQTGLGDLKKAEGSIGLQRAFLSKGARSVLVSLWNVDDRATRLLMEKFYVYWLDPVKPRTKAEALQMAQDAVRRTPGFAHPKYWAAFQLVGAD